MKILNLSHSDIPEFLNLTNPHDDPSWLGGETLEQAKTKALTGDSKVTSKCIKLFDKYNEAFLVETPSLQRDLSPVGSYPCVPAYLNNHPYSMYGKSYGEGLGPIKVYVDGTAWCALSPDEISERGIAIAAWAYAQSILRPVELIWYTNIRAARAEFDDNVYTLIPIGKSPLDISRLAYVFGYVGFIRRSYSASLKKLGWNYIDHGNIPFGTGDSRKDLKLSDDDINFELHKKHIQDVESYVKEKVRCITAQ